MLPRRQVILVLQGPKHQDDREIRHNTLEIGLMDRHRGRPLKSQVRVQTRMSRPFFLIQLYMLGTSLSVSMELNATERVIQAHARLLADNSLVVSDCPHP